MLSEMSHILHEPLTVLSPGQASRYMNKVSSPGYPHNIVYPTKGEWLNGNSEKKLPPADYPAMALNFLRQGFCFWSFTHKVEIRSLDKLLERRIRGFTGGTADENLAALMYLHDLFARIAENWKTLPYTYGLNAFGGGWHYLTTRNPVDISSWNVDDATGWDGSMPYVILCEVAYDLLSRMKWDDSTVPAGFPPIMDAVHTIVLSACLGPVILPNGIGGWKYTSNCSGGGATIQLNSWGRRFIFLWFALSVGVPRDVVERETRQDVHGDDSRKGTTPRLEGLLSLSRFQAWCSRKGLLFHFKPYGDSNTSIQNTKYLSRLSVKIRGMWTYQVEKPEKLIASACLGASDEPPEGWSRLAYHLMRIVAITNELVTHDRAYNSMCNVVRDYISAHDSELQSDPQWQEAKKCFVNKDELLKRLLEGRGTQEAGCACPLH